MNFRTVSWLGLVAVWLAVLLSALLTRPLIPVDETRYAAVAWEMWQRGDFLVPWLNGEPYSHKPPLFFWLVHAGWWLFGVQEWVLRAVAPVTALLALAASGVLARQLWPKADTLAWLVPWLLFGSVFYTSFYSWVQIDMLLVLFTVLAMNGMIRAGRGHCSGWLVTGIALGLGALAKGPVILLHVLPVALLAPLWKRDAAPRFWRAWYTGVVASVLLGAAMTLAWALPAAQAGGAAYSDAIFWGQTANRLVESFAHNHPVWWYLPWLAVLFAPWCFLPWVWSDLRQAEPARDEGLRFCLVWLLSVFALLSLVSGKQLKYLLPLQPAFALLVARASAWQVSRVVSVRPWLLALVLALIGAAGIVLPLVLHKAAWINMVHPVWGGLLVIAAITVFLLPARPSVPTLLRISLLSVFVVAVAQVGVFRKAAPAYDLQAASRLLAEAQAGGREVAVMTPYHGQFGFHGRLTQPVLYIPADRVVAWAQQHPDAWVVMVYRGGQAGFPQGVFTQPYRGGYLVIREARAVTANPDLPR
jgi:4-amino-4-deoxy-L-arabinose transferase-like glycosyltransferase